MTLADGAAALVQLDADSILFGKALLALIAAAAVPAASAIVLVAYRSGAVVTTLKFIVERLAHHDDAIKDAGARDGQVREQIADHSGRLRVLEDRSEREAPDHEAQHRRGGP